VDSDGDGLQDVLEDRNRNCRVDPGETDPNLADTDGDGLLDGEEDINRNGRFDPGLEAFDATLADTDGDRVPDGEDLRAAVCVHAVAAPLMSRQAVLGDGRRVLLDRAWEVRRSPDGMALAVLDASGGTGALLWLARDGDSSEAPWQPWLQPIGADVTDAGVWGAADGGWTRSRLLSAAASWTSARALWAEVSSAWSEEPGADSGAGPGRLPAAAPLLMMWQKSVPDARGWSRHALSWAEGGTDLLHWAAEVHPGRIAPDPAHRLQGRCDLILLEAGSPAPIVMAADSRSRARESVLDVVRLQGRAQAGQDAPAWLTLTLGDAHVASPPFAELLPSEPYPGAVLAWLSALPHGRDDQRLWYNLLRVLLLEGLEGTADRVDLWMVASTEDTEFRQGDAGGLDGHPSARPLPDDLLRRDRIAWYRDRLTPHVSGLHAVAPPASSAHEGCESSGMHDSVASVATSYETMAALLGGSWFNLCTTGWPALVESVMLHELAPVWLPLSNEVIPGGLALHGQGFAWSQAPRWDAGRSIRGTGDPGAPVAVFWLSWEAFP
jgi:hypothetical protein